MNKKILKEKFEEKIYENIRDFEESCYLDFKAKFEFYEMIAESLIDLKILLEEKALFYLQESEKAKYKEKNYSSDCFRDFKILLDKSFESEIKAKLEIFF